MYGIMGSYPSIEQAFLEVAQEMFRLYHVELVAWIVALTMLYLLCLQPMSYDNISFSYDLSILSYDLWTCHLLTNDSYIVMLIIYARHHISYIIVHT